MVRENFGLYRDAHPLRHEAAQSFANVCEKFFNLSNKLHDQCRLLTIADKNKEALSFSERFFFFSLTPRSLVSTASLYSDNNSAVLLRSLACEVLVGFLRKYFSTFSFEILQGEVQWVGIFFHEFLRNHRKFRRKFASFNM